MSCYNHSTVVDAMREGLTAIVTGPYRIEYVNETAPWPGVESESLAILERDGNVVNVVDIDSEYVKSLVEYYGAKGVPIEVY